MRLTASAKRFRGCGDNWSDSIRQQFNAQQQLLLTIAEKATITPCEASLLRWPGRVQALSNVAEDADDTEMHDLQMFSLMADGLQQVGDALFALFASDIHVERRVITQDLICEELAEKFAWEKIQSLEAAEVDNLRIDNAALTFAVFSQFASRCSTLVQESAPGFPLCRAFRRHHPSRTHVPRATLCAGIDGQSRCLSLIVIKRFRPRLPV
jgi:hypothetical protein